MLVIDILYALFFTSIHSLKVRESMSSDGSTSDHTTDGNHSKTSVLKLHKLHLILLLFSGGVKSQGVEGEITRTTVVFVHVGKGREGACLKEGDPSDDLDHGVWEGIMGIDYVGDGLERELLSRDAHEFWYNHTYGGKHGSTSVLELGFTEPWEPLWGALSKSDGIEVNTGQARGERDGLGTLSSNHTIGEGVYRNTGAGNLSRGKGSSSAGKGDKSGNRLHGDKVVIISRWDGGGCLTWAVGKALDAQFEVGVVGWVGSW
mmetsp:Transcript_19619/g.29728  ORF Transcript_19619/g.29728 Transcript_19619/m.29728 type:complete len:261 (-) Transcript_19619:117-899(-)